MSRAIEVHMGETPRLVGTLRYDRQVSRESAAFEYDRSWLSAADRFAIDPALPLLTGLQFHKKTKDGSVFHPAIADTEPDGWARQVIRRDHAKRRVTARDTGVTVPPLLEGLDFLLEVDDVSRIGPSARWSTTTAVSPSGSSPASATNAPSRRAKSSRCG